LETALELGRRAALIKLADGDMNLGARPATAAAPRPPAAANVALTMPRPTAPAAPTGIGPAAGLGQHLQGYFRNPANMARLIGATGGLGRGVLGAVGAPGLFALSNIPRGFGEMGSILRGGIPTGNGPGA
jgi:hypothetical protein